MNRDLMVGNISGKIGRGLVAGLAGTAAITVSQMIEMRLRDREPSTAPAEAASRVLGVDDVLENANDNQKQNLSHMVHWGYGTGWGTARALLDVLGIEGIGAALAQFAGIWATALFVMPKLENSKPANQWPAEEVEISAFHHIVYVLIVGLIYELLSLQSNERQPRGWLDRIRQR
jgi:hypothetical protein